MPLNTIIERDGEALELKWGGFHVAAMVLASSMDSGTGPFKDNSMKGIYQTEDHDAVLRISPRDSFDLMDYGVIGMTPLNAAPYTLKEGYIFVDTRDGEVLELKAGDVLKAYRS